MNNNNNKTEIKDLLLGFVRDGSWSKVVDSVIEIVDDQEENDIDGEVDWNEVRERIRSIDVEKVRNMDDSEVEDVVGYIEGIVEEKESGFFSNLELDDELHEKMKKMVEIRRT